MLNSGQLEKLRSVKAESGSRVGGEVVERSRIPLMASTRLELAKVLLLCATYAHGYLLLPVSACPLILSSRGLFILSEFNPSSLGAFLT